MSSYVAGSGLGIALVLLLSLLENTSQCFSLMHLYIIAICQFFRYSVSIIPCVDFLTELMDRHEAGNAWSIHKLTSSKAEIPQEICHAASKL